jgi:hypothetical protein
VGNCRFRSARPENTRRPEWGSSNPRDRVRGFTPTALTLGPDWGQIRSSFPAPHVPHPALRTLPSTSTPSDVASWLGPSTGNGRVPAGVHHGERRRSGISPRSTARRGSYSRKQDFKSGSWIGCHLSGTDRSGRPTKPAARQCLRFARAACHLRERCLAQRPRFDHRLPDTDGERQKEVLTIRLAKFSMQYKFMDVDNLP